MAKTKQTREPTAEELEHDQLRRELGFDELTYEACFRELFGELFDVGPRATADAPPRVTQMGPGRRHGHKTKPTPEEK
jgi:hypothetical protein